MIIKPRALQKNDTICLIAPAGPCKKELFLSALDWISSMGFNPFYRKDLVDTLDSEGYMAGEDRRRLEEIHLAFLDPEVKGILCLRGGYGSMRLLPGLDKKIIANHPKVFIGFSDITALLNYMTQHCSLVTFHGPMPSERLKLPVSTRSTEALIKAITGRALPETITDKNSLAVAEGKEKGILCGGCLSLVVHLLGTPYEINTRGKILFLEDIGEEPYRIDRMLTHLKLAGKLEDLKGLAFGEIIKGRESGEDNFCLGDFYRKETIRIIREILPSPPYPVVYGLPCGHGVLNLTLPLGLQAELDSATASLRILEYGVQ